MDQLDPQAIGSYIARKRNQINMTPTDLAHFVGVTPQLLMRWEEGKALPSYSYVDQLTRPLGITLVELLHGRDMSPEEIEAEDEQKLYELLRKAQMKEKQKRNLIGLALVLVGILFLVARSAIVQNGIESSLSTAVTVIGVVFVIAGICVTTRRNQ